MKRMKRILFTLAASLGLIAPVGLTAVAHAAISINDNICNGAQLDPNAGGCANADIGSAGTDVQSIIATGIDLFSLVVGIIAVIMIIIGGVKYITSGGDAGNVTGAKNTILYAIIGLIVVALAQTVVFFVLDKATT